MSKQVYSLEKVNFPLVIAPYGVPQMGCTVVGVSGHITDGTTDHPDCPCDTRHHLFVFLLLEKEALPFEKVRALEVTVLEHRFSDMPILGMGYPYRIEETTPGGWILRDEHGLGWEIIGYPRPRIRLTEEELACFSVLNDEGQKVSGEKGATPDQKKEPCQVCGWKHDSKLTRFENPKDKGEVYTIKDGFDRHNFLVYLHSGMVDSGADVSLTEYMEKKRSDGKRPVDVLGKDLLSKLFMSTGCDRAKIRPPDFKRTAGRPLKKK